MIKSSFREIDYSTKEGMLLMSALAILTSLSHKDITDKKFGGVTQPDDVFKRIQDLANKIYFEEEYKKYLLTESRDSKINNIINEF